MKNNILQINAKQWLNLDVDDENLRLFDIYHELVTEWNTIVNLTSISGYDEFMLKHILDSLVPIKWMNEHKNTSINVIDVGTGAGFPGLPIKIIMPELKMYLIESNQKKTKFLKHVVDTLNLKQVTIINERSETIGKDLDFRETFDVALSRGVSRLDVLSELTNPLTAEEPSTTTATPPPPTTTPGWHRVHVAPVVGNTHNFAWGMEP